MSDEHVRRSYIVEDKWKCGACGAENLGRFLRCQNCGAPKGKKDGDVTDVDAAPEVTDEKLLGIANAGANWVCTYCGSQDRAPDGRCRNCGARQEEARSELPDASPPRPTQTAPTQPSPAERSRSPFRYIAIGALLLGVLGVYRCLVPHAAIARVVDTEWTYTSELHQRTLSHGSGFDVPSGAFNLSCEMRQHGSHSCDPYRCNVHSESYQCHPHDCQCHKVAHSKKNGFSEVQEVCSTCYDRCQRTVEDTCYHQCPDYARYCRYDYYDWPVVKLDRTQGHDASAVRWPTLDAHGVDQRLDRSERYEVTFDVKGTRFTFKPSGLDEFRRYTTGDAWKVKVNAAGSIWPIEPQ